MVGYFTTEAIAKNFTATVGSKDRSFIEDLESISPKGYSLLKNILSYTYDNEYNSMEDIDDTFDGYGLEIHYFVSNAQGVKGTDITLLVNDEKLFLKQFNELKGLDINKIWIESPNAVGMGM